MSADSPSSNSTRRALITGASSGIGRAIALQMAESCTHLIIHARANLSGAEFTAKEVRDRGAAAEIILADLSEEKDQDKLCKQAWSSGPLDILVNNAGADVLTGEAAGWTFEQKLELLWKVDVRATLRLSRTLGQQMRKRGSGLILNMSWDQAATGMAGESGEMFGTIKGAIASFSKSLAASLAPQVRVNCLAPGWIKTAWGNEASDYWQQRAVDETLLQRWGTPEDVAQMAGFLASPAAEFITGQVMNINGGFRSSPMSDQ